MAALLAVAPRTPSPEVRIRSQSFSFESPSSLTRLNATTPIEDYPFSKSTGTINTTKAVPQHHVLLPLRTKMSEESLSDTSSAMSISTASSPTTSSHRTSLQELPEGNLLGLFENAHAPMPADALTSHPPRPLSSLCGTQSPAKRARFSPPGLQLPPSVVVGAVDMGPASPFAFQDPSSAMTSPWLVRVVLDLHDVHRLCWMDISDVVWRMHGVQTCSGEVLGILSGNGRVRRSWWE